jgi:hypothetical protein
MFARLGSWQGSAEELKRWIERAREHVKPGIREDAGLKAAYWLVDRAGRPACADRPRRPRRPEPG